MKNVIYIAIAANVIYFLRFIPILLIKRKIKSVFFRSFFTYMPYAILTALAFPSAFYSTGSLLSAVTGVVISLGLAVIGFSFPLISVLSCIAVYIVSFFAI